VIQSDDNSAEKPTEIVEKLLEELPKKVDEILGELKPKKLEEIHEELKPKNLEEILEELKLKKVETISRFPDQQDPPRKVVRVVKRPKNGSKSRPVNLNHGRKLGNTLWHRSGAIF